LDSWQ